eukprot:gnl/MRDRNA2_/MRDRNA2_72510_c0_seq3.p1 gnl/MRDRNA2_/MRDRNA2_72510_c0~~gnl/MRDRNA2_/MRDRNA2_72510_c0_seq3.p1  ORF type:complete len:155 (+),score=52.61 gnl/MRDRNA2_/MRDRNA2_72510_c0_seq3:124-588(+)
MGAGASAGIAAATQAASVEDISAALSGLSADDKAKISAALGDGQATKMVTYTFECSDSSGDLMEISFEEGETKAGTFTFSNASGTCKYTNPDGEELTFSTAKGSFTVAEEGTLALAWKPVGKKKAKHTVKIEYGVDGKAGTYHPRVEVEDDEEE